eukprot:194347_1
MHNNVIKNRFTLSIMSSKDKLGPLITFGSGGLLAAYYIGVISFLRDHFDINGSMVSISGVSCGSFAAMTLFLNLSVSKSFEYLFMLKNIFVRRKLWFFLLKTKEYTDPWLNKTTKFENTDISLNNAYRKYGNMNAIYFGCSVFNWSKLRTEKLLIGDTEGFTTMKEMIYAMTLSSRIFPFYRSFGKWKDKKWVFDGGLTQEFAISEFDYKNREIISVSVFPIDSIYARNFKDTICPESKKDRFSLYDIIKPNCSLTEQLQRYRVGYLCAAKQFHVTNMLKKGLKWNGLNDLQLIDNQNRWNQHIQHQLQKNVNDILEYFNQKILSKL